MEGKAWRPLFAVGIALEGVGINSDLAASRERVTQVGPVDGTGRAVAAFDGILAIQLIGDVGIEHLSVFDGNGRTGFSLHLEM